MNGAVLGMARIDSIAPSKAVKLLKRCPHCGTTAIQRIRRVGGGFKCRRCERLFGHPKHDEVDVTSFAAHLTNLRQVPLTADAVRALAENAAATAIRPLSSPRLSMQLGVELASW